MPEHPLIGIVVEVVVFLIVVVELVVVDVVVEVVVSGGHLPNHMKFLHGIFLIVKKTVEEPESPNVSLA